MKLQIATGALPTPIELELKSRLVIMAGPNGVGKSRMLYGIANRVPNQRRNPRAGIARSVDGTARLDGKTLTPQIVTYEQLYDVAIPRVSADMVRSGRAQSQLPSADALLKPLEQISDPKIRGMVHAMTSEDRISLQSGTVKIQQEIIRALALRSTAELNQLIFGSYTYHEEYAKRSYAGQTEAQIISSIGNGPWIEAQRLLDMVDLPYRLEVPCIKNTWIDEFTIELRRKEDGSLVDGGQLSSGERVLLWLINLVSSNSDAKDWIYLFDELDGFLHPESLSKFAAIVEQELVERKGSIVLWATHSPMLVQMLKKAAFFYISSFGQKPVAIDREDLITRLTGGTLVVFENISYVFSEGADHSYYNDLVRRLEQERLLKQGRSVRFLSSGNGGDGAGWKVVHRLVEALGHNSFGHLFSGLVDRDFAQNVRPHGVAQLSRYSIENFWLDPINIYAWMVTTSFDYIPNELSHEIIIRGSPISNIGKLKGDDLQRVIDYFSNMIEREWDKLSGTATHVHINPDLSDREEIVISGERIVRYPKFLLVGQGREIINRIIVHNFKGCNCQSLSEQFLKGAFWPMDLVETLQRLARNPS
jgi:predicted ATPase